MAEFITHKEAEIKGSLIESTISAMPKNIKDDAIKYLKEVGITSIIQTEWYNLQKFLNMLKYISIEYGNAVIFSIGKEIPKKLNETITTSTNDISKILDIMANGYLQTHRNGELGNIELIQDDKTNGKVVIKISTPYPCEFDRGILTSFSQNIFKVSYVERDLSKPNKMNGANESWFIIDYVI